MYVLNLPFAGFERNNTCVLIRGYGEIEFFFFNILSFLQLDLLKSTEGAEVEWSKDVKGNMYDMVVEGFQLLSRWTGRIWEQCAWKFSRPCKDVSSEESNRTSTLYSDYEKALSISIILSVIFLQMIMFCLHCLFF